MIVRVNTIHKKILPFSNVWSEVYFFREENEDSFLVTPPDLSSASTLFKYVVVNTTEDMMLIEVAPTENNFSGVPKVFWGDITEYAVEDKPYFNIINRSSTGNYVSVNVYPFDTIIFGTARQFGYYSDNNYYTNRRIDCYWVTKDGGEGYGYGTDSVSKSITYNSNTYYASYSLSPKLLDFWQATDPANGNECLTVTLDYNKNYFVGEYIAGDNVLNKYNDQYIYRFSEVFKILERCNAYDRDTAITITDYFEFFAYEDKTITVRIRPKERAKELPSSMFPIYGQMNISNGTNFNMGTLFFTINETYGDLPVLNNQSFIVGYESPDYISADRWRFDEWSAAGDGEYFPLSFPADKTFSSLLKYPSEDYVVLHPQYTIERGDTIHTYTTNAYILNQTLQEWSNVIVGPDYTNTVERETILYGYEIPNEVGAKRRVLIKTDPRDCDTCVNLYTGQTIVGEWCTVTTVDAGYSFYLVEIEVTSVPSELQPFNIPVFETELIQSSTNEKYTQTKYLSVQPYQNLINATPTDFTFMGRGGTGEVTITFNTTDVLDLHISKNADWITYQYNNGVLTFDVAKNPSDEKRVAEIYLQYGDATRNSRTITINQYNILGGIDITTATDIVIPYPVYNDVIMYQLKDVEQDDISVGVDVDWITISKVNLTGQTVQYIVGYNNDNKRSGYINIIGTDTDGNSINSRVKITQLAQTGYIVVQPTMEIGADNGEHSVSYTTYKVDGVSAYTNDNWISINGYDDGVVTYTVDANNDIYRQGTIYLVGTDRNGFLIKTKIDIFQMSNNTTIPIWRDSYYIDIDGANTINYTIKENGNLLYSGVAQKTPNNDYIKINVSKLVYNYLSSELPNGFLSGYYTLSNYCKKFTFSDGTKTVDYDYYNSYSYSSLPSNNTISVPIKKTIDRRQYFLYSMFFPSGEGNYTYSLTDGFNQYDKHTETITDKKQHLIIDNDFGNYTKINVNDDVFDVVDGCYEYCLYYLNAFGGWDSLLVGGNNVRTDKITSSYYNRAFDNTTIQFEKSKYLNVIIPTYKLYTDYFTDEEQSKLWHLLESNEVYLHNLNDDIIYPVNITNTKCEYTTFKNNGRKKFYNTIDVEVSQQRVRRV